MSTVPAEDVPVPPPPPPKHRAIKEELIEPMTPPETIIFLEDLYYGVTTGNDDNDSAIPVSDFLAQVSEYILNSINLFTTTSI